MTRNTPIGAVTDDSHALAVAIRRRIASTDGYVQVWASKGDVYAQAVITRAAVKAANDDPYSLIGVYSKISKVPDIEADVVEMQRGVIA